MDVSLFRTFSEVEQHHWWFQARREIVLAVAEGLLPDRTRVLDVGCGTGYVLERLQQRYEAFGLDVSPVALELCRDRGLGRIARGGAEDLSSVAGSRFGGVFLLDVLEHLNDDVEALVRLREVLIPGGVVIITVPAFMFLWSPHDEVNEHRRRYTRRELSGVLTRAGFEVERTTYFNASLFPLAAVVRLGGRVLGTQGSGGLRVPPRPLNTALRRIFAAEKRWLTRAKGGCSFPFGVSLLAVGRRAA